MGYLKIIFISRRYFITSQHHLLTNLLFLTYFPMGCSASSMQWRRMHDQAECEARQVKAPELRRRATSPNSSLRPLTDCGDGQPPDCDATPFVVRVTKPSAGTSVSDDGCSSMGSEALQ